MASNLSPETGDPDTFSWFPSVPLGKSRDNNPDVAFLTLSEEQKACVLLNVTRHGRKGKHCPVQVQA